MAVLDGIHGGAVPGNQWYWFRLLLYLRHIVGGRGLEREREHCRGAWRTF